MNSNEFKKIKTFFFVVVVVAIITLAGYFGFFRNRKDNFVRSIDNQTAQVAQNNAQNTQSGGYKTFIFDNFHGNTDISDKFSFQYPADWYNDGRFFSPQKIQFYDKYEAKAPIWFDLVLAKIFDFTELKYQIDQSKRKSPDTVGQIDGQQFKRYDLIDYGTYGGTSAGRVKIFVGPKITIDGADYYLVFHWEEKPLAEYVPGNNIDVFDQMLLTLKFVH